VTDIYEAHLRSFLAAAEQANPADRIAAALAVLGELDDIGRDWDALLDLAAAELRYERGLSTVAIGEMLGRSHTTAGTRSLHGKKQRHALVRVVSAARRAAERLG
jgi:hypothetical protein